MAYVSNEYKFISINIIPVSNKTGRNWLKLIECLFHIVTMLNPLQSTKILFLEQTWNLVIMSTYQLIPTHYNCFVPLEKCSIIGKLCKRTHALSEMGHMDRINEVKRDEREACHVDARHASPKTSPCETRKMM